MTFVSRIWRLEANLSIVILLLLLTISETIAQTDRVGPGHALRFDGVNDYVELGDVYDDLALPVTIAAWINVDSVEGEVVTYPLFDSQDNSLYYNGITVVVSTTPHLGTSYGDGAGGNNPAFRRSRAGFFNQLAGKWN